jgi:hypothetical protein
MFHIGRKTFHVGAEKFITLNKKLIYVELKNFSFTFNDAEDYATSEKWQKKIFISFLIIALRHICVMLERKLTPYRELHLWPPLYRT